MGDSIVPANLRPYSADVDYNKLTGMVLPLTGHEFVYRRNGQLISRAQRAENFWHLLRHFNDQLNWDFSPKALDACELMYLGLSEATRYDGEDYIKPGTGENTAAHSPHAILRGIKIIRAAEKLDPSITNHPDFLPYCQILTKALMVHDFGEVGGEPGSLGQQIKTGVKKDKPRMERLAMDYFLTLAIHLAEKYPNRERQRRGAFFAELERVKKGAGIQGQIIVSDDDLFEKLNANLGERPELSPSGKELFSQMTELWDMIETKGVREHFTDQPFQHIDAARFNLPFLSLLASACEHTQGTAHFVRFLEKEPVQDVRDAFRLVTDGNPYRFRLAPSKRQMGNIYYSESEIGPIFAAARTDHPVEQALARAIRNEAYEYTARFIDAGPRVIYLGKNSLNEASWTDQQKRADQLNCGYLIAKFHAAMGEKSDFICADDIAAMYRKAVTSDFIPGPREILALTRPENLFAPHIDKDRQAVIIKEAAHILASGDVAASLLKAYPG